MSDVRSAVASPGGRVSPVDTRRIASAMLFVTAVVVVAVFAVWRLADGGVSRGDERLYGTIWVLESASLDGEPVDVTAPGQRVRWEFRFYMTDGEPGFSDTPVIVISDGCGQSTQELDLDDSTGRWTRNGWGYRGSPACAGAFSDVLQAVFQAETFDYSVDEHKVSLTSHNGAAEIALRSLNRAASDD